VGESGCGKSVTAQAILQIIPHPGKITNGEILLSLDHPDENVESINLTAMHPRGKEIRSIRGKDIGMIFQEPMSSLSPVHTVGSQIIEAIHLHQDISSEDARARAIDLLGKVGIPKPEQRVDAYSFELSGGMRQRAMIAMALSCQPSLLIADEPTTALDVTIQAQILEVMQRLQEDFGMSILLITHNLGVIAALAHRIVVMYLGKIVEVGTKTQIFENPLHPYTRGLLNSVPKIGKTRGQELSTIKGVVPPPFTQVKGCAFHPRCNNAMPGICDQDFPETQEIEAGHTVACYLYSEDLEIK
jgi:oligopeptide/dipeptide ABC transporter ATP-binding protein